MSTPAGWYDDPNRDGYVRWWDGARWTDLQLLDGMQPQEPTAVGQVMAGLGQLGKLLMLLCVFAVFVVIIWVVLF